MDINCKICSTIASLPSSTTKKIFNISKKLDLKKGDFVYQEGDLPKGIYFVKNGLIALVNYSKSGEETLLRLFGNQFFFGHRSLIANEPHHANTIALRDSTIYHLPLANLDDLIKTLPEIIPNILVTLSKELRMSEQRLHDYHGQRATARIIESLLFLKCRDNQYKWTRREIGDFSGTKMETVTRVLSKLEQEDLIEKRGREIIVKNEEKLLEFASTIE